MQLQSFVLACGSVIAVAPLSPLRAQTAHMRRHLAVSAGLSSYVGNFDVAGAGALARVALHFESAYKPLSAQVEGTYHRFAVLLQACPTCPGCRCLPQAPPATVLAVRVSGQWHLRGVPGGLFVTGGIGAYTSVAAPGQRDGPAVGYDLGLGFRRARRGLLVEARYLRLSNAPTTAWLVPLALGFLF